MQGQAEEEGVCIRVKEEGVCIRVKEDFHVAHS
jgi:hypothetical protein